MKMEKSKSSKKSSKFSLDPYTRTMVIILPTPRSRTAWLTAFLNTAPQTLALHDPSAECDHVDQIPPADVIIDTLFALRPEQVMDHYPEATFVTLIRDSQDVNRSLCQWTGQIVPQEATEPVYKALNALPKVMSIPFLELDQRLPELWALITDAPFPHRTHEQFKKLNIQRPYTSYDMHDPEKAVRFLRSLD